MVERKEARAGEQLAASINRMGRKRKGLFRKPLFRRPEEEGTQKYALKEGREGGRPKEKEGNCNVAAAAPLSLWNLSQKANLSFHSFRETFQEKGRAAAPATTRSHISLALGKILSERGKRKEAMEEEVSLLLIRSFLSPLFSTF